MTETILPGKQKIFADKVHSLQLEGHSFETALKIACELIFPADFEKCMGFIKDVPERKNDFINFLEQLVKPYRAPEEKRIQFTGLNAIKHIVFSGIGIKGFFSKSRDNDPTAYTTDHKVMMGLWSDGQRRFKTFIRGRFLAIDIDRKPGKPDGLEAFYRIFPRATLPMELKNLPESFPCYVQTPSGGFHLYFKYEGPELKLRELAPGVEIKEWQITAPGSRRENGEYILHGELDNAPPLYGLIIDRIENIKQEKSKQRTIADHPVRYKQQPRTTLDALANETLSLYAGNHDRQVSFSGRACRCKFSGAEVLVYVKSHSDIFGSDKDTENTVLSVYRGNGVI